jgi:hypothetical protein
MRDGQGWKLLAFGYLLGLRVSARCCAPEYRRSFCVLARGAPIRGSAAGGCLGRPPVGLSEQDEPAILAQLPAPLQYAAICCLPAQFDWCPARPSSPSPSPVIVASRALAGSWEEESRAAWGRCQCWSGGPRSRPAMRTSSATTALLILCMICRRWPPRPPPPAPASPDLLLSMPGTTNVAMSRSLGQ